MDITYYYVLKNVFALGCIFCLVWMFRNKREGHKTSSVTVSIAIGFFLLSALFWILDW